MPHKSFNMAEEDKDEEEVLFSYNIVVVDIDFGSESSW